MGPASQPLVALGFMAFTHPDLTHRVALRKDLAQRLDTNIDNVFVRTRRIGSDVPDSKVVIRAIIVETTTYKSRELKTRCMEKLAPQ